MRQERERARKIIRRNDDKNVPNLGQETDIKETMREAQELSV